MLYTSENMRLGNAGLPHHLLFGDCQPPADINDDGVSDGIDLRHLATSRLQATQMSYLLLKFRLYDICDDMCERVINTNHCLEYATIKELDMAIDREQRSWNARYYDYHVERAQQLPIHHQAHLWIL